MIPARLGSSRLPRKPLLELAGRPLIAWVWERVSSFAALDRVVVATDHPEVIELCRSIGAEALLTDRGHPSGTDRVAEVAGRPEFTDFDFVVNLQGDEPLLAEEHLEAALALVRSGGWKVGSCATPVRSATEWRDPNVVKVVRAQDGAALYFSRAPIPAVPGGGPEPEELAKATPDSARFLRHLGIYCYRREALLRWVALPTGELEEVERLEQLRPLAAGLRIGVAVVEEAARGVDTPEDATEVASRLRALTLNPS